MTHVITGGCCNDAACVAACPVNCIHPTPDEREYAASEMLYIDPATCIDCGACVDVCPVAAVVPDFELEPEDEPFLDLNAAWYTAPGRADYPSTPTRPPVLAADAGPLRVAVIGTGPAASYVIEALLAHRGLPVEITVVERLLTPGGLVRHGVAPDHPATKAVGEKFARLLGRAEVSVHLGVEVGRDVSLDDLRAAHHAVIVATGAATGRRLGLPGEELTGSHSAVDFVGWYNGHPDHAGRDFELDCERAVVIGNGNVALDVARVLLADEATLRRSDIAPRALDALIASSVREVVVVGRRGPECAAFTAGELIRLEQVTGLTVGAVADELPDQVEDPVARVKVETLRSLASGWPSAARPRVVFRFGRPPLRLLGEDAVSAVELGGGDGSEILDTGLVLSAIGYRPTAVPGLAVDSVTGVAPNDSGRVRETTGIYVAGWLKRGPSGGIGTNKWCARETVAALVRDHESGELPAPTGSASLAGLGLPLEAWTLLDRHERAQGRAEGRPRRKVVSVLEQRSIALGGQ